MSNGRRSYSVEYFDKTVSNRYSLILTLYELSTTSDRIAISKSIKLRLHCIVNTPEFSVISVKFPFHRFTFVLSCKRFGNCWSCKTLNENIKVESSILSSIHCLKSVQIRSFFWSIFFCIRTEYGREKTPYLHTFHAVIVKHFNSKKSLILA